MSYVICYATLVPEVLFLLSATEVEKPSTGSRSSLHISFSLQLTVNSKKKNPENFCKAHKHDTFLE